MRLMEEKILSEGKVLPGGVLKVGSFLNQQIDCRLLKEMGREIARLFSGCGITKVMTIESSGIAVAVAAGMELAVPVVFAKKHRSSNVDGQIYSAPVHSFTHNTDYSAVVSRDYLREDDVVLLVDDFLATGNAFHGLILLCGQAGARVAGICAAVEKGFQDGGDALRRAGYRVESLAVIDEMNEDKIVFRPQASTVL